MTTWNSSKNTPEEALNLPEGRYAADFGFWAEQFVDLDNVLIAAQALKDNGQEIVAASQAAVIVNAQEKEVAFTDWAKLKRI